MAPRCCNKLTTMHSLPVPTDEFNTFHTAVKASNRGWEAFPPALLGTALNCRDNSNWRYSLGRMKRLKLEGQGEEAKIKE